MHCQRSLFPVYIGHGIRITLRNHPPSSYPRLTIRHRRRTSQHTRNPPIKSGTKRTAAGMATFDFPSAEVFLQNLPRVPSAELPDGSECCICQQEYGTGSANDGDAFAVRLPCEHIVGNRCINRRLSPDQMRSNTCPCVSPLLPLLRVFPNQNLKAFC